jgi:hypothetical protein
VATWEFKRRDWIVDGVPTPSGSATIRVSQFGNYERLEWLKQFAGVRGQSLGSAGLKGASLEAVELLADRVVELVKNTYRQFTGVSRMLSTVETYRQGKKAGKTGSRFIWAARSQPFGRTGHMIDSVKKLRTGAGTGSGYLVTIDPKATYAGHGDVPDITRKTSVAMVANQMEEPIPEVIKVTARSIGYLKALQRGTAGPPRGRSTPRVSDPDKVLFTMAIWPRARPVWAKAYAQLYKLRDEFANDMIRILESSFPK